MAQDKGKGKASKEGHVQKHLHSRISYLYQAATYLANATEDHTKNNRISGLAETGSENYDRSSTNAHGSAETESLKAPPETGKSRGEIEEQTILTARDSALSCQLLNHLRAVSLKSVIRMTPAMKHSICKRCDVLLIPGSSATAVMENKSREGRKVWADILVVTCVTCGTAKRIPVGAKRQLKKQYKPNKSRSETEPRTKRI